MKLLQGFSWDGDSNKSRIKAFQKVRLFALMFTRKMITVLMMPFCCFLSLILQCSVSNHDLFSPASFLTIHYRFTPLTTENLPTEQKLPRVMQYRSYCHGLVTHCRERCIGPNLLQCGLRPRDGGDKLGRFAFIPPVCRRSPRTSFPFSLPGCAIRCRI
jgi:hypothetical protein